jgi:hypothetical protein
MRPAGRMLTALSTLVIGLISVTPSFAQSVSGYSRNFGYPSYAGAPYQAPVFGSSDYGDQRGRATSHTQARRGRRRE